MNLREKVPKSRPIHLLFVIVWRLCVVCVCQSVVTRGPVNLYSGSGKSDLSIDPMDASHEIHHNKIHLRTPHIPSWWDVRCEEVDLVRSRLIIVKLLPTVVCRQLTTCKNPAKWQKHSSRCLWFVLHMRAQTSFVYLYCFFCITSHVVWERLQPPQALALGLS